MKTPIAPTMRFRSLAILALTLASPATAQVDPALFGGLRYRMIGPSRGGRVTTVTGVPSQPFTFYQGSTGGGVWKTTNAGTTWENVSDAFFGEASMGAVEVSLSDPNVVWAGPGVGGDPSHRPHRGGGVPLPRRGGDLRWMGLREAGQIGAVRIHPT